MPNTPPNLIADGNIYPCRFVKISPNTDDRGLQAGANADLIGISFDSGKYAPLSDIVVTNYHATQGDALGIFGDGEQCLLELGDTVVRGNRLKADADGKGVPIATTGTTLQRYGAIALQSGVSGEKVRAFVELGSERPAIT